MDKIKYLDSAGLRQMTESVNGEISALAKATLDALAEVYENMELLEKRACGYSYDAVTEKLTLPQSSVPAAAAEKEEI